MSLGAAVDFLNCISEDEALASKVEMSNKEQIIALARARGYEMNMDEFRLILLKAKQLNEDELSEDELDLITAGIGPLAVLGIGCFVICMGIKIYLKLDENGVFDS